MEPAVKIMSEILDLNLSTDQKSFSDSDDFVNRLNVERVNTPFHGDDLSSVGSLTNLEFNELLDKPNAKIKKSILKLSSTRSIGNKKASSKQIK